MDINKLKKQAGIDAVEQVKKATDGIKKIVEAGTPKNLAGSVPGLDFPVPHYEPPHIEPPQFVKNAEDGLASEFHKRLKKWINEFDAELDDKYDVGVRLVSFGQTVTFHLENMGYWNPFLISFQGHTEAGDPVELIQNVNQISILLMKLPRPDPAVPKEPFGFNKE